MKMDAFKYFCLFVGKTMKALHLFFKYIWNLKSNLFLLSHESALLGILNLAFLKRPIFLI